MNKWFTDVYKCLVNSTGEEISRAPLQDAVEGPPTPPHPQAMSLNSFSDGNVFDFQEDKQWSANMRLYKYN